MDSDRELLDAWRDGDRAAGDALFERHFDSVCRFFRNKVNDSIEDLIQRTFLACIENRDKYRGDAEFRTFMLGIARHMLFRYYRDKRRDGRTFDVLDTSVHDLNPSPSAIVAQHKDQERLLKALRRIPMDLQIALELHYWEGMTTSQIAEILDIPHGTASSRIRRAKENLLRSLGQTIGPAASTELDERTLDAWAESLRASVLGTPEG